ncbi:MAG: hypothetical protein HY574_09530 [candidate division NC10 bacterium]|nr:hypothetical protein [candidate division NC10 bacterium]
MAQRKFKLSEIEIHSVGLVDKPVVQGAKFVLLKGRTALTPEESATLDVIIEKHAPLTARTRASRRPAPDAVPQHELARVAAFLGRR